MSSNILVIRESKGVTKLQSLVDAVNEAVSSGAMKPGDSLPSVNEMSRFSGFSRDTVVKAYNILKQQQVIESTPAKGFFITGNSLRIFMLLDDFSAFKEQLYRGFRENLPSNYSVDLLFHYYNMKVFDHLVRQAAGRYSLYVIMNISNKKMHPVLSRIDPDKLLVLDMGDVNDERVSFILQNFDTAVGECLDQGKEQLEKYSDLVYIYSRQMTPHPPETEVALRDFCLRNGLKFHVMPEVHPECMTAGQVYFVITESDLVKVLKGCRQAGLSLGKELGIVAFNDTPMKEVAGNGITVISVDFTEMGRQAAEFVRTRNKIRKTLPTRIILRASV